jgi:O-antigen ligase
VTRELGFGAAGLLVLAALTYNLGTGSPIIPRWLVIYVGAAIALTWFAVAMFRTRLVTLSTSELVAVGFIAYLIVTLAWSSDPRDGLLTAEAMLVLGILYFGLRRIPRKALGAAIYVGATIALAGSIIFGFAYPVIYAGVGNENFLMELHTVLLPLVVAAWCAIKTPVWWIRPFALPVTLMALYFILFENLSDSKWVAACAVGAALMLWLIRQKRYYVAGFGFLIPLNIALWSGWATSSVVVKAITHRLEIGFNSALLWAEKPFFGHGLGSFNFEYGRVQEAHLQWFPEMDTVLHPASVFAGAAHNELLQLGADAGLVGVLIALALIGLAAHRFYTKKKDALDIGAAMALLIAAALSQISFPLQNPATVTVVVFAAAALMQGERPRTTIELPVLTSRVLGVTFLLIGAGLVVSSSAYFLAERTFSATKANIKVAHPAALQANLDAYQRYPFERRYRHQLMLTVGALLKAAHGDITITKEAADQAYRIARTAAPYMPAIKMSRLEYLLNNDLWKIHGDEIDELLGWLTVHASLQPGVWLADGAYALRIGDVPRLVAAINTGMALPTNTHRPGFELLAGYLRTETETPS